MPKRDVLSGGYTVDRVIFIDTEVSESKKTILDYGAALDINSGIHTRSGHQFLEYIQENAKNHKLYLCGHNIIRHDMKYLEKDMQGVMEYECIDTLMLSPLLFPSKPYHALLKDDKLQTDELNNPLHDALKAMELYYDEQNAFAVLDEYLKDIYTDLLYDKKEFRGFFSIMNKYPQGNVVDKIHFVFKGKICENCNIENIVKNYPVELAYVLALLSAEDSSSIIPHWVNRAYPMAVTIMRYIRGIPCEQGCLYCRQELNIHHRLKNIFGYDDFRKYDGENLQEQATAAAVKNKSILAIFPTGGGKSITFQLPALIAGETTRALTVVISPLQSLMKDQVDNLERRGIVDAVTVNGLLSPIERAEALERVENGMASILYISPESLRSNTIERLLLKRTIARFVIDEAHCFSAWGQDFRVDYLYIGDFIRELQKRKGYQIPVFCFTATAKQKVISDIREYFKEKLQIDLQIYASSADRKNLRYEVIYREDEQKYDTLRSLIEQKDCPTIVYVSRRKRTEEIAQRLCADGYKALPFHGNMDRNDKQNNQNAFINDDVQIIVATSAFGMGVDKSNVKLVVHYDISDSLENYVQEAGRAGRDPSLQAECYVLYNDNDLNEHFSRLNQTKLSISEIQQVWRAIKNLTGGRAVVQKTALEIARQAGWDENVSDIETRVKTAIQALENAGYVKRGKNCPKVFATSIMAKNMVEASKRIEESVRMDKDEKQSAKRIISMLISARSIAKGQDEGESRIDYIADRLGMEQAEVFRLVSILREERILSDDKDMTAYIYDGMSEGKTFNIMSRYEKVEKFLVENIDPQGQYINLKELNNQAIQEEIKGSTISIIKTIFYYWTIRKYISKSIEDSTQRVCFVPELPLEELWEKREKEIKIAKYIAHYLYDKLLAEEENENRGHIGFSILELKQGYVDALHIEVSDREIENALLYLAKIDAMKLEGGFLVLYNGMTIKRIQMDNKIRYKVDDYQTLNDYYTQKIQQIHIVGEFANMMVRNYADALQFVNEYFNLDYKAFLKKYFEGNRRGEINRNITPEKYNRLFDGLTKQQREIIDDKSQYIVVPAGPGSGKTKVLVHKLASLMLLEDIKQEQLLMLTFSRAAAYEFKQRLIGLIGTPAKFVEIKTFHSYCFDLLGEIGDLNSSETVVERATQMIRDEEVEQGKITKTVLVIDEAQDMDAKAFALVQVLIEKNDGIRVIVVGDDDQNIYEWRQSSSEYFQSFAKREGAVQYELVENHRSAIRIVNYANKFTEYMTNRMKTKKIMPMSREDGYVEIVKCDSEDMEIPIVHRIEKLETEDSIGVLVETNDAAGRMLGLLKRKNIKAKLIQEDTRLDLYDLMEIRYFIMKLQSGMASPVIDEEKWKKARREMAAKYRTSANIDLCERILDSFAAGNARKYKSDLEMFLHESKLEDFYVAENHTAIVSTIHKAKGKEYDNVFVMLNSTGGMTEERKRAIYVAITRAKKNLFIYYHNAEFGRYIAQGTIESIDKTIYGKPEEILLQFTHKEVVLDFFMDKKRLVQRLVGGMELPCKGGYLYMPEGNGEQKIAKFSKNACEIIEKNRKNGYEIEKCYVRFIVGWKNQKDGKEYPIILPDIYMRYKEDVR